MANIYVSSDSDGFKFDLRTQKLEPNTTIIERQNIRSQSQREIKVKVVGDYSL